MEYTIKNFSRLTGTTPRTLRYYDSIGLLKPKRINSSGYRLYGEAEVNRMQQILFFRELDMPLEEIKRVLEGSSFDEEAALKSHQKQLQAERDRLDRLLQTVERTLAEKGGGQKMNDQEKFAGFKQNQLAENEKKFGQEVREKYGEEAANKANQKFSGLTEEEYGRWQELGDEILKKLLEAKKTEDPFSEEARTLAEKHREWLSFTWANYTPEAHRGLADLYTEDERFTRYYDEQAGEGAARFLRDAVYAYTEA